MKTFALLSVLSLLKLVSATDHYTTTFSGFQGDPVEFETVTIVAVAIGFTIFGIALLFAWTMIIRDEIQRHKKYN